MARRARSAGAGAAGLARGVLAWTPVWMPVCLCVQIAVGGLRPALREHRRLERAEEELRARHAEELAERRRLDALVRAQSDPVYLERERRARLDPNRPVGR